MEKRYSSNRANNNSRQYARNERRRKKKMRRIVLICILFVLASVTLALLVYAGIALLRKPVSSTAANTTQPQSTENLASPPPFTPEPATQAASPTPTIDEDRYRERCDQLYHYLDMYGNFENPEDIAQKLSSWQIDKNRKMVALTFDDGPSPTYTAMVLDILERYNVRATFFIQGSHISGNEELLQRALALGCEIGNHTMNHEDLEEISDDEMRNAVSSVNDLMQEKFGYTLTLLRPPYISFGKKGSEKRAAFVQMLKDFDMACINHTRSSHDTYADYTAEMISERMLQSKDELGHGIDNSIFLFHDKSQKTVDALPRIIEGLLADEYQLVTVSELLNCSEEGLHSGWIYSKAD